MTAAEVLDQARAAGLTLTVQGGHVAARPPELLSPLLAERIVRRRHGIMRLLGEVDHPSPLTEYLDDYRERLQSGEQKRGFLSSPWSALDFLTGGFGPGNLIVIAARPKMGKSAFGQFLARHIAYKHGNVLFFSFEMDGAELAVRQVCQEALVPALHHEPRHVQSAIEQAPRIWVHETGRKLAEVVRRIRCFRLRHQEQAAGIVIDQLGHLLAPRQRERRDELTEILATLKATASEEKLPILGMHQISRATEARNDKRPTISDLKDSGSFEEYASQVLLLYRPGYYRVEEERLTVEVDVAANRHGQTGVVKLSWHPSTLHFGEVL